MRLVFSILILLSGLYGANRPDQKLVSAPERLMKNYEPQGVELFSPGLPSIRNDALREIHGVLIDSSKNGYGLVVSETNPISRNEANTDQIILGYRKFIDMTGTSGAVGMAYSDDGGATFQTFPEINGGLSTPGGRYPSVLATENYPVILWNESGGGGGGDYGGRAFYTFDEGEYGGGIFYNPVDIHNNPIANDSWIVVPTFNTETGVNNYLNVILNDWSNNRDHISFHAAEYGGWQGTELEFSNALTILNTALDFQWNGTSNYISTGNMDINDNGVGYYVVSAYWADAVEVANHTLFVKKTSDYGATWSNWYWEPDELLDGYFEAVFPDSVWDDDLNDWTYPGGASGAEWSPFLSYDIEVITDPNDGLHVWDGVLPSGGGIVYIRYSEENGIYHFYSPGDGFTGTGGPVAMEISSVGSMQLGWTYNLPGWSSNVISAAYDKTINDAMYLVYYTTTDVGDNGTGTEFIDANLMGSYSLDNGSNWSIPENLTMTNDGQYDEIHPHINRVADNGHVYIMYQIPDYDVPTVDPPDAAEDHLNRIYFWDYNFELIIVVDSTLSLNVESSQAAPGAAVGLIVDMDLPADSSFSSFELSISGHAPGMDFLGIDIANTLLEQQGWTLEYAEDENHNITIAAAGANPITASGSLLELLFQVLPETGLGYIPVEVTSAIFDNGAIEVEFEPGGVDVIIAPNYGDVDLNGFVNAYDASQILQDIVGYIDLNAQQQLNADVSLDGTISGLDASLILQYRVNLIDDLPYDSSETLLAASGMLGFNDPVNIVGSIIEVPLFLTDIENLLSLEGELAYNTEHLTLLEPVLPASMSEYALEYRESEGGARFVLVSTIPHDFDQDVIWLRFELNNTAFLEAAEIELAQIRLNEQDTQENVDVIVLANPLAISDNPIPDEFELTQNYPNPFNPSTQIRYGLAIESQVSISIYDISGRLVSSQSDQTQSAGWHEFIWNATDDNGHTLETGVYFCSVVARDQTAVIKMLFLQ